MNESVAICGLAAMSFVIGFMVGNIFSWRRGFKEGCQLVSALRPLDGKQQGGGG